MMFFWTVPLYALPFRCLANSTACAFAPPPFRGSAIAPFLRNAARPSMAAYVATKNPSWIFRGLQKLRFCMLLSRRPWLFIGWQERAKNPSDNAPSIFVFFIFNFYPTVVYSICAPVWRPYNYVAKPQRGLTALSALKLCYVFLLFL